MRALPCRVQSAPASRVRWCFIALPALRARFGGHMHTFLAALAFLFASTALAQPTPAQRDLRDIYQELVEINTTDSVGSCTDAAQALAKRLKAGGFADSDLQI